MSTFNRRGFFAGTGMVGFTALAPLKLADESSSIPAKETSHHWPDFVHQPPPQQAPATHGTVSVHGAELAYWDTGGPGTPVVFMHARSGSLNSWPYQQPELARLGFRVIGYSRRGHEGSTHTSVGFGADDLHELLDSRQIAKAHLVGHAAGGLWAMDFAATYPDRLHTLTVACSTFGIIESEFAAAVEELRPNGFEDMPPEFRELGPSYRAADPVGVAEWLAIENRALNGPFFYQGYRSPMDWAAVEQLSMPVMIITGDSDLYMPPTLAHQVARRIHKSAERTIQGSGHCPHWERPRMFNSTLDEFFRSGVD